MNHVNMILSSVKIKMHVKRNIGLIDLFSPYEFIPTAMEAPVKVAEWANNIARATMITVKDRVN